MSRDRLQKELEEQFQWFHSHPELSYEEYETTKKIKELLKAHDIEILDAPLETGVVAVIRGEEKGPVVALRSDIDALPIQEETALPWKSQTPNKMHACGHDFHTTAIYGTALLLKERQKEIKGTIKLLFQPAEESSLGALKVIEAKALDDVDVIFGIHSSSQFPVGTLGITEGNITAAVDTFQIKIKGYGTHGAHPDAGKDPIIAATALINGLQTIVSRNINPFDPAVISVTHLEAGNTWNVIPETAFLEGTVRTLSPKTRAYIEKRIREQTEFIGKAYGVETEVIWIAGPPATDNDPEWTEFAREIARKQGLGIEKPYPSLGGEDFAFYQQTIKGSFIQIGTGETYPNHHPKFEVDPAALSIAAEYVAELGIQAAARIK